MQKVNVGVDRAHLLFDVLSLQCEKNAGGIQGRDVYEIKTRFFDQSGKSYDKVLFVAAKTRFLALEWVATISKKVRSEKDFDALFSGGKSHTITMKQTGEGKDCLHSNKVFTRSRVASQFEKTFQKPNYRNSGVTLSHFELEELEKMDRAFSGKILKESRDKSRRKPIISLKRKDE